MQQPAAADVGAALERVYARSEFTTAPPGGAVAWIREQWQALLDYIRSLLRVLLPENVGGAIGWIVLGVFALLALWALVTLIQSVAGQRRYHVASAPSAGPAAVRKEDPSWWEGVAREAAAARRFREAAFALYTAAVLRLDERGVVEFESGKTPGDYRREARRDGSAGSAFDDLLRRFLPVAFDAAPPAESDYEQVRTAAAALGVHG